MRSRIASQSSGRTDRIITDTDYDGLGGEAVPHKSNIKLVQVQPYFPEPIIVSGNVAAEHYDVRLRFLRSVLKWHLTCVTLTVLVGCVVRQVELDWLEPHRMVLIYLLFGFLIGLNLIRRAEAFRWGRAMQWPIYVMFLGLVAIVAGTSPALDLFFLPIAASSLLISLYAVMSGRDFSFVGQMVLASITFGLIAFGTNHWLELWPAELGTAVVVNIIANGYHVYDLASLLQRRRLDERWLAGIDMHRDILNFLGYFFRVIHHWRTFRI